MAKDKNKKKKKKFNKKPVSMLLKQNLVPDSDLSQERKNQIYACFRARCEKKSMHAWFDNSEVPELLRLYMKGSLFDSTVEFLVQHGSFKPIMGKTGGSEKTEVGFQVKLKNIIDEDRVAVLKVFHRQYKATLHIPA